MEEHRSVADIEGPWRDPDLESSVVARCRENWRTPVGELSNQVLATFIRQELGLTIVLPEAKRRISSGVIDDSELYDGELAEAIRSVR